MEINICYLFSDIFLVASFQNILPSRVPLVIVYGCHVCAVAGVFWISLYSIHGGVNECVCSVLYVSLHRGSCAYPIIEDKYAKDVGEGAGVGYNINIVWSKVSALHFVFL